MVCRRFLALSFLAMVMGAFVAPSCTDCADGGVGCPCQVPQECNVSGPCVVALCDGTCWLMERPVGAACSLNECVDSEHCDGVCTDSGACVQCLRDSDCGAGHSCEPGNVCTTCTDGLKNGDEVDVDCGGSCTLCPGTCNVDADCPGGYCWESVCARCDDGIKNGDETDVDCGGYDGHCGYCPGLLCQSNNAQCASKSCEGGVCCSMICPLCYKCELGAGECVPVDYRTEDIYNVANPVDICMGTYLCDGKGNCRIDTGNPCFLNEDCVSDLCLNGTCK